ncbi:hypothetical protein N0V82_008029 [Gnomoniopsis sp. IMI 355080]|nr:hypothetical protein N0V82_008029 [Gnomoniopsis sp. IMI 355080]
MLDDVDDQGDSEYLSKQQQRIRASSFTSCDTSFDQIPAANDVVAAAGAEFLESQADTLTVNGTQPGDDISLNESSPTKVAPSSLGDEIRKFAVTTASIDCRRFYPIDSLEEIMTRNRIRQALENTADPKDHPDKIIDRIVDITRFNGKNTRRLKILAILALMYKDEAIVGFINEGIYDIHLPLERRETSSGQIRLYRNRRMGDEEDQGPILCTDDWSQMEKEMFEEKQYQVCIPIFELPTDESTSKVSHYNLHPQSIIPFIQDDEGRHVFEGGFGQVWRVQLHPAHHNLRKKSPGDKLDFAVKKLQHDDDKDAEAFRMEVSALNRFSNRDHPHLIKLLCTYYWRGHYYFLFPWAEGNLESFWKKYSEAPAALRSPSTARWMSKQCLGLVKALKDIQMGNLETSPTAEHEIMHPVSARKHGKHGDLKPENILFFQDADLEDDVCSAHFKISDFGLAEWHTSKSMNVDGAKVKRTPTYRAPELDIMNNSTPSYDIWSLACVLLEFVTWYIGGWTEVELFTTERLNEGGFHNHNLSMAYEEDIFFKHVRIPVKGLREPARGAMPKHNVTKDHKLQTKIQYNLAHLLTLAGLSHTSQITRLKGIPRRIWAYLKSLINRYSNWLPVLTVWAMMTMALM